MATTRRRFLESVLAAPFADLGARRLFALNVSAPGADGPQFAMPHFARYDAHCFTVDDRDAFIFSASFHYPRCRKALWRDRLHKLKLAGFNTIETYVFWNYHEPEEGHCDLSEFDEFAKLVGEMGLWMIARPGPYVCAEWDAGGFPHWVIAKRFPLRSNDPESIRTSQHWFGEVLPVIERHLVTHSGPIILVQIENEYDYWKLGDDAKRAYITALAQTAWSAGIDVPLITCWTKQVRERSDPVMARIADFCNFYPRWNIVKEVVPGLEKLRAEETASPVGVVELQGGWFSQFGGKLSVDQEGVGAAQLNMLSKTVIEAGATYFNYYMGFGGTNFDWAGKKLTTTYDYAAPLREPGGTWDKYYAARGLGAALKLFGDLLTRAVVAPGAAQSTNSAVSASERVNGKSGVVFVRENSNAGGHYKLSFRDPNSPTHRWITTPREGELAIGAREMKMLPVQVPIAGGQLRYTTAEVLAHGEAGRPYLILYDEPDRLVEISLSTESEPQIEGDTVYRYWDPEYESSVFGVRVGKTEQMLLFNGHLQVIVSPRDRALQSWTAAFPWSVVPGEFDETGNLASPFLTDAAWVGEAGTTKHGAWIDLHFRPGSHDVTTLLPPLPSLCRVNDAETSFQYDRHWETARLNVTTPTVPYQPVILSEVETWVEKFDPASGQWLNTPLRALEDLGAIPYGYVKYRAEFSYSGESRMFMTTFADDGKKVFINGKLVPEASVVKKQVEFALASYAHAETNLIEIAYEPFGSPNFGESIGELKGIESVGYGADASSARAVATWQVQRVPAAMRGRGVDPEYAGTAWSRASLTSGGASGAPVPAFTWCRAEFSLPNPVANWQVPWELTLEADRDALIYLNGKFVGRYVIIGPQKDFYLPEPDLVFDSKTKNVLTLVLAYAADATAIRTLRVAPYAEFSTYRTRVEFEW